MSFALINTRLFITVYDFYLNFREPCGCANHCGRQIAPTPAQSGDSPTGIVRDETRHHRHQHRAMVGCFLRFEVPFAALVFRQHRLVHEDNATKKWIKKNV